jgi:hypothetical protein
MSLQIGAALKSGGYRLVSRTGAILTVCYLALYAVYQTGYNALLNALYARAGVDAELAVPVSLPTPVAAAVVGACLLGLSYLSVVAIRTFVAGDRDRFPRERYAGGMVWAVPNLFVGGLVAMILMTVGFVLLFVPGVFLLVSLLFMAMYVAVDGDNFVTAMRRSWALARGNRWSILGLVLVVSAIGFTAGIGFSVVNLVVSLAGFGVVTPLLAAALVAPMTMFNVATVAAAFDQLRSQPTL